MATGRLPEPSNTEHYRRIPFQFTEELSSKNVFLRLPDSFSPLERMLLQATGNLQRIMSAYYNVPSHVKILKNNTVPNSEYMQYDRKIVMYFEDKLAYEADSILIVKDANVIELIEKHKYGLGQIFGHTHRSPDFVLHAIGRHGNAPGASFWRDYSLTIPMCLTASSERHLCKICLRNTLETATMARFGIAPTTLPHHPLHLSN
ncbi:hypothetical protein V8B55DRAFT_1533407 [Mucor lusitanicus]